MLGHAQDTLKTFTKASLLRSWKPRRVSSVRIQTRRSTWSEEEVTYLRLVELSDQVLVLGREEPPVVRGGSGGGGGDARGGGGCEPLAQLRELARPPRPRGTRRRGPLGAPTCTGKTSLL